MTRTFLVKLTSLGNVHVSIKKKKKFCSKLHSEMTGGTTSSELPVFYVPMFKQSSVSKSSRIRNLSETHLSAIWLLPCDLTGLRGPQLKTCCWRDDAAASARTRVFKWPGKAPEQTPVRWFTSIKWISSCLMMPVGAELHCTPMTQAIPSRQCLSASAPCKLCPHDLFSFFFFPMRKTGLSVLKLYCQSACFCKKSKYAQWCYSKCMCVFQFIFNNYSVK